MSKINTIADLEQILKSIDDKNYTGMLLNSKSITMVVALKDFLHSKKISARQPFSWILEYNGKVDFGGFSFDKITIESGLKGSMQPKVNEIMLINTPNWRRYIINLDTGKVDYQQPRISNHR